MAGAAQGLGGYALFAALLAAAGLPIYIHAPKAYVDEYGVSLAALGAVLFGLRLIDVVQDPALGWLAERLAPRARGWAAALAVVALAGFMLGLFWVAPPMAPLAWFALMMTGLFSAFSFLSILFYAQGVARAGQLGPQGHVRLAAWRETGALLGLSAAAVAPVALGLAFGAPLAAFALGFAVLALAAGLGMRREWGALRPELAPAPIGQVLGDRLARRLLLVALVNAAPLAITSTLFLFFVESRLAAPGWEGPLLLLFFLAAAGSAPLWGRLALAYGARRVLIAGMVLAIGSFGLAASLGAGDVVPFALICVASGAALGADMTLLPALFARRMAEIAPNAGQGFGLWAFVSKFTLAFAAVTLFPLLERAGFTVGADNPEPALQLLSVLYALVPCALKLAAIALLATAPLEKEETA